MHLENFRVTTKIEHMEGANEDQDHSLLIIVTDKYGNEFSSSYFIENLSKKVCKLTEKALDILGLIRTEKIFKGQLHENAAIQTILQRELGL